MGILISAIFAIVTTCGAYAWQARQSRAEGAPLPERGQIHRLLLLMHVVWAALMTVVVWIGFMDPVRSLGSYPFYRLGVSLLIGGGFVATSSLWAVAAVALLAGKDVPKRPLWRRINPMGFQMLFIMFSGLAFQHSGWGGPP